MNTIKKSNLKSKFAKFALSTEETKAVKGGDSIAGALQEVSSTTPGKLNL